MRIHALERRRSQPRARSSSSRTRGSTCSSATTGRARRTCSRRSIVVAHAAHRFARRKARRPGAHSAPPKAHGAARASTQARSCTRLLEVELAPGSRARRGSTARRCGRSRGTSVASTSSCSRRKICGCREARPASAGASSIAPCSTCEPGYLGDGAGLRQGARSSATACSGCRPGALTRDVASCSTSTTRSSRELGVAIVERAARVRRRDAGRAATRRSRAITRTGLSAGVRYVIADRERSTDATFETRAARRAGRRDLATRRDARRAASRRPRRSSSTAARRAASRRRASCARSCWRGRSPSSRCSRALHGDAPILLLDDVSIGARSHAQRVAVRAPRESGRSVLHHDHLTEPCLARPRTR